MVPGRLNTVSIALACALLACSGGARSNTGPSAGGEGAAGAGGGTGGAGGERVVDDLGDVAAALGQRVRIKGTAQNAKISAAVVADDLVVYCLGHDAWPDDVLGGTVTITGTLESTDEFAAQTSPTGEISAGTSGPVLVLRGCAPSSAP